MRRAVAIVLPLVLLITAPAFAEPVDHPITGAKLVLKQSSSGKQKLVFQSKDPSFVFPPPSDLANDPRLQGATIEVVTAGVPPDAFAVPPNAMQPGWTYKAGSTDQYKYKRDKAFAATTEIRGIVIKDGRGLTIQGDATGIPLDGARGTVGIRITIGDHRSCARFTGAAVTKDVAGAFQGKNAPSDGVVDCALTSLTGASPVCGDGEVNQPSENCDVTCSTVLGEYTCRPPGTSNECQCCTDFGPLALPCCNPSSIAVPMGIGFRQCYSTGCTPPDSCRAGDECRPDESCCSTNGGNLCRTDVIGFPSDYALVSCCAGLECGRFVFESGVAGAECCAGGGTSCTGDGECCTGHCQLDGTCEACRAGGAGCATSSECCSQSCTAGTCDACAPPGTICTSDAACCSGTCANMTCD